MTDAAWTRLRRADRAMRDPDDIEALLRRGRFGYTATTSGDQPFLHPTTFWYDQKARRIYVHGARQGRTLQNVTQNPRVCFGVAEMGRMLPAESACAFRFILDTVACATSRPPTSLAFWPTVAVVLLAAST